MGNHDEKLRVCEALERELGITEFARHIRAKKDCGPADEICEEFTALSAVPWTYIAKRVNKAFDACCDESPPTLPGPFVLDCSQDGLDCDDVCAAFVDWACAYRVWAASINAAMVVCFGDKFKPKKAPGIKDCDNCQDLCKAMNKFHKGLTKWLQPVRDRLNDEDCTGGTDPVPDAPEPPPFS